MSEVAINIRCSNGDKFEVQADLSCTVLAFKEIIREKANVTADAQRLIYKGRILKDEDTLESYAVKANETIHLVKRPTAAPAPTPAATGTPSFTASPSSAAAGTVANPPLNLFDFQNMGGAGGAGSMGGMPDIHRMQEQLMSNPEMMANIMNSPMMQNMLNNPETLRNMMVNNPQMRQVIENNPQLNHVLNDPAVMQQALDAMRSPAAMREMMRNQDRAMSNIEAHPEGFNALRRMYHDVQEPMMQATADMANQQQNQGANSQRRSSGNTASGGAFPNPWAAGGGGAGAAGSAGIAGGAGDAGTVGSGGGGGAAGAANPWASMFGGGADAGASAAGMGGMGVPPLPPGMTPESMAAMMRDPFMQQMLRQSFQNPAMIDQMVNSNPMLQQMLQQNPAMRDQLPQIMSQMADPNNLAAMMRMQQSMQQLQQAGLLPPATQDMMNNMNNGQFGWGGGLPALLPPAPAPTTDAGLDFSSILAAHGQPVAPRATAPPVGPTGVPDLAQLFASLQPPAASTGMPGTSATSTPATAATADTPAAQAPVAAIPPEERFATQLSSLDAMGFTDRAANIRALTASQGNVNIAVERLLSGNP